MPLLGLQIKAALIANTKVLAGVRRHRPGPAVGACGACDGRTQIDGRWRQRLCIAGIVSHGSHRPHIGSLSTTARIAAPPHSTGLTQPAARSGAHTVCHRPTHVAGRRSSRNRPPAARQPRCGTPSGRARARPDPMRAPRRALICRERKARHSTSRAAKAAKAPPATESFSMLARLSLWAKRASGVDSCRKPQQHCRCDRYSSHVASPSWC